MSVQITLDPNQWIIGPITPDGVNQSHGMPLHPFNPWNFNFPLVGGDVDYVTTGFGGTLIGQSWARIEFEIIGDGGITPTEGGYPNGQIHMLLFDNWFDANGRFWSPGWDLNPGHYIMTVPLDYTQWHNVNGQNSEFGFVQMLGSPTQVGITFGGDFSGHGVFDAFGAPDNFRLLGFEFVSDPTVNLTSGDDNVSFFIYDDVVFAFEGNDRVSAGRGNDFVSGGFGSDTLQGNQGNDTLQGNQDNDFIFGGQGHDLIFGGQGDDHMWGNLGNDTINGNLGVDTYHLPGNREDYGFWFGDGGVYIWAIDTGPQAAQGLDLIMPTTDFVLFEGSQQTIAFDDLL